MASSDTKTGASVLTQRLQTLLGDRGGGTGEKAVRVKDLPSYVSDALANLSAGAFGRVEVVKVDGNRTIASADQDKVLCVTSTMITIAAHQVALPGRGKEGRLCVLRC